MAIYFTSDHHFCHAAARSFYRRPFSSIAEMDQVMIDRWNAVVEPRDELWHLGDFAVRQSPERVAYSAEGVARPQSISSPATTTMRPSRTVTAGRAFSHMRKSPSMERSWYSATTRSEHGGIWLGARSTYTVTATES